VEGSVCTCLCYRQNPCSTLDGCFEISTNSVENVIESIPEERNQQGNKWCKGRVAYWLGRLELPGRSILFLSWAEGTSNKREANAIMGPYAVG